MQNLLNMRDGNGEVSARLIAKGSGGPFAQMAIDKLQELRELHFTGRSARLTVGLEAHAPHHPTLEGAGRTAGTLGQRR